MSTRVVYPWIAINDEMNDDYRNTVVEIGLNHLNAATPDLAAHAKRVLSHYVRIRGFRSNWVDNAPVGRCLPTVIIAFTRNDKVTSTVIALWAEAKVDVIMELSAASENVLFAPYDNFDWEDAVQGFVQDQTLSDLQDVAERLCEGREEVEQDHLRLAAYWLSGVQSSRLLVEQESGESRDVFVQIAPDISPSSDPSPERSVDAVQSMQNGHDDHYPQEVTVDMPQLSAAPSGLAMNDLSALSLDELDQAVIGQAEKTSEIHQTLLVSVAKLHTALTVSNITVAAELQTLILPKFELWRQSREFLFRYLRSAHLGLEQATQERPDLAKELLPILPIPEELNEDIEPVLEYISATIRRVRQYDADRAKLIEGASVKQLELDDILRKLTLWGDGDSEEALDVAHFDMEILAHLTIKEIQDVDNRIKFDLDRFRGKLEQAELANRGRLVAYANLVKRLDVSLGSGPLSVSALLADVDRYLLELTIEERKATEYSLSRLVEEHRMGQERQAEKLAAALHQAWNDQQCVDLVCELISDHRNLDACLLLLSAIEVHSPTFQLELSSDLFHGLHNGLVTLAQGQDCWLWSRIAARILPHLDMCDSSSHAELALLTLAAHVYAPDSLPASFLWQVSHEWPRPDMQSWSTIWRAMRDGVTVRIDTDTATARLRSDLDVARDFAENVFERQTTGLYIKAGSVADRKYRKVLNSHLLPDVEKYHVQLRKLEVALMSAQTAKIGSIRARIAESALELDDLCSRDAVKVLFEQGLAADGMDNFHAFHGKKTMSILNDALSATARYARALLAFSDAMLNPETEIDPTNLRAELDAAAMLSPSALSWIETIEMSVHGPAVKEDATLPEVDITILECITGQAESARRFPRLAGSMVQQSFSWPTLLERLLFELSHPVADATEAARILIDSEAPNQALLFAEELPVELQKEAIALSEELRRKFETLRNELIRLGGDPSVVTDAIIRLHMWGYAIKSITLDIDELRVQAEHNREKKEQQTLRLLSKMQQLESTVWEHKQTMPADAFTILRTGLSRARDLLASFGPETVIERFVKEIDYRVQHRSWSSIHDLKQAVEALSDAGQDEDVRHGQGMSIDSVVQHLRNGSLDKLRLNPKDFEPSRIDTRIAVCESWIYIRDNVSEFVSEKLHDADKTAIGRLFADFAKMTSMKIARTIHDQPRAFSDPVMHSVFELITPKTVALDRDCTMVCLPGGKPNAVFLGLLDELLEGHGWLTDGGYVFLFAPGVPHDLYRRLQGDYGQRGLVIINEQTLIDLLLAEADALIPLGRLRSLMLNARGAQNIDIFKVNQLVHARTSIFVGRDALVSKIVSSGENYVLYGGRRIGKSSVLQEVRRQLDAGKIRVVYHSFEGESDRSDRGSARTIGRKLGLDIAGFEEFKSAMELYLTQDPTAHVVFLFDEIDGYITRNPERHILIESLRTLSDQFDDRLRVVAAGFVELYKCVKGQGPYSPNSDPWTRMFNDELGPLPNLRPSQAEKIVQVGFKEILGWNFESHRVPQLIVERTGGHPAFVQYFCLKLQRRIGTRSDRIVRIGDIDAVFEDVDPTGSFISHVKDTLFVNNIEDAFGQYLLLYLAVENNEASQFTFKQAQECAELFGVKVPLERLNRNLDLLTITSVIRATSPGIYEFSVPDYPSILARLGDTHSLDELEYRITGE